MSGGAGGEPLGEPDRTPKTIVAIGEALWDVFPDGRRPGGAPCNVAYHVARLGNRGAIVTRVGRDAAGTDLIAFLREQGVTVDGVQRDPHRPTGTVTVTIVDGDPRYAITDDVAWDYLDADPRARALVRAADAVCVGSLAQRHEPGRAAVLRLLEEARGRAPVVFDVNLRPPFIDPEAIHRTLELADVVKMNESEAATLATLLERPSLVGWLLETVRVRAVCVTRGPSGAAMITRRGTWSVPGMAIEASMGDAVGSGDAFTAAIAHALVRDTAPFDALQAANRYAALVASKPGGMPRIADDEIV